ncbi:MAG: 3'-5' exonuclease [Campylobacterales bacterium]|nr:3'-5' exonuclease [Campylobacterales bacterium]
MAKYIILDTETTGTGETDRIIQLGYIVLGRPGEAVEVHNAFCSSEVEISLGAMETHHITPDMIEDKPQCINIEAYKRLVELNSDENYMIIHNAPFDLGMLEKEGFKNQMQLIDTLRCAKHLYGEQEFHRLQYLRYALELYKEEAVEAQKLGVVIKAHDAIGDVLILKLFMSALTKRAKELHPNENPMLKLVELTKQPVYMNKPLRFGKNKGKTIEELVLADRGYIDWMRKNMDLDEDMQYTIKRAMGEL